MATCRERQFETIAPQDTARLVYLASYMDNDGILRKNKSTFIRHSDLSDLLQLSRTAVFHFWNAVKDKFIVELPTGELKILDCFFKGPLHGDNGRLTKIFIKNVRQLYTATPTRQHVYLGYFFQVLYHINVEYNILCKNPYEDFLEDVEPMTIVRRTVEYGMSHYAELDREGHWRRTVQHLEEKYSERGYIKLWLEDSPNAAPLEELRALIADKGRLREVFDELIIDN